MKEAEAQTIEDMETTYEVLGDNFAIPTIFFERPQWDKFPGAIKTFAADALMESGKVLQLPSTHLLGTNFSKGFNVKFTDEDGEETFTCQIGNQRELYYEVNQSLGDHQAQKAGDVCKICP